MSESLGSYMVAEEMPNPGRKTRRWSVTARSGGTLGIVQWYGAWRQYVFQPGTMSEFSAGCLRDLAAFLERVNREHGQSRTAQRGLAGEMG
jgi:hypothetical protein